MEPHGQSPWSLHYIPSYAKASAGYPPTPTGAETLWCDNIKASAGYPPEAESAVALTQGRRDDLATGFAFIHGQSPCLHAEVPLQNIWQERVSARRHGLLRRRIKKVTD